MQVKYNNITLGLMRAFWYASLLFFAYLMLLITLQYVPLNTNAAFLQMKQDVSGKLHYQLAFFTHVYSSIFVLAAGIVQMVPYLQKKQLWLHKITGRIYVFTILLLAGPTGLVMGYYGNGGWSAQVAFCMLAILWILFTYKGLQAVLRKQINAHKIWMYRSYALTLSAISLRFWKWLIVLLFEPRPMDVYRIVAWLGWVGNLLIAELIIRKYLHKKTA